MRKYSTLFTFKYGKLNISILFHTKILVSASWNSPAGAFIMCFNYLHQLQHKFHQNLSYAMPCFFVVLHGLTDKQAVPQGRLHFKNATPEAIRLFWLWKVSVTNPIPSMYGVFTYIWLMFKVNVGK